MRSDTFRSIAIRALFVLIIALGIGWVLSRRSEFELQPEDARPATHRAPAEERDRPSSATQQRRPDVGRERRREVVEPRPPADPPPPRREDRPQARERAGSTAPQRAAAAPPAGEQQPAKNAPPVPPSADFSQAAIQRALGEFGLDTGKMADLQRRWGELAADEAKLRQDAQAEEWMDSPEFAEEFDAIEADRMAIRNELGDEGYDIFLFASGQTNRVYLTGVEQHSPAEVAGLQTGDVIVRYDGARVFSTDELLAKINATAPGTTARLDITRQGQPLQVEIGAGPPGIVFDATQEPPASIRR